MEREILIIMAKEPRPGFVKTRLTPALTPDQAAGLYEAFLFDIVEQAQADHQNRFRSISFVPLTARPYFLKRLPSGFDLIPQRGATLGKRLTNVVQDSVNLGFDRIVIRNSDSPLMDPTMQAEAFAKLSEFDAVISPDGCGGYSLIGLKKSYPQLFDEIPMSTDSVLEATLSQAKALGLQVHLLEPAPDVDCPQDLRAFSTRLQEEASTLRIPRTLARMKELNLSFDWETKS